MTTDAIAGQRAGERNGTTTVTLSPWVNEPPPNIHEILCSRDLVRLTRRSRWELLGLQLIGKFPQRKRYRGRPLGWCKTEVLEWMAGGLSVAAADSTERLNGTRRCARRHARQGCLPLECRSPCISTRRERSTRFVRESPSAKTEFMEPISDKP